MKFDTFIQRTAQLPLLQKENLVGWFPAENALEVQLTRWTRQRKLVQLKRGLYLPAEPYRKINLYEPYLASVLKSPSYLSLEKALECHGLIPEAVPTFTSVTTKRPGTFKTPVGNFDYKHIQASLFWGYEAVTVAGQTAFIATPEKAVLDLIYLRRSESSLEYWESMRLGSTEKISTKKLTAYAKRFEKPRILRAAEMLAAYLRETKKTERVL